MAMKSFILALIWGICLGSIVLAEEKDTFLVGYWKFDEGKEMFVTDSSGNENDGLIAGATWVKGKSGSALKFKGEENNNVKIPFSESLRFTDKLTCIAWVYPTSYWKDKLSLAVDNINTFWLGFDTKGCLRAGFNKLFKEYGVIAEAEPTPTDKWCQIAITYDGSEAVLYKDGQVVASKRMKGSIEDKIPILLGGRGGFSFTGIIDEVKVYNRALSAEEIEKDYQRTPNPSVQVKKERKNQVGEKIKKKSVNNIFLSAPWGLKQATLSKTVKDGKESLKLNCKIKDKKTSPALTYKPSPSLDVTGYTLIEFYTYIELVKCKKESFNIEGQTRGEGGIMGIQEVCLLSLKPNEWNKCRVAIKNLNNLNFFHMYLRPGDFSAGDEFNLYFSDFQLVKGSIEKSEEDKVKVALYLGEKGKPTMFGPESFTLPFRIELTTGKMALLTGKEEIYFTFRELFTGTEKEVKVKVNKKMAKGKRGWIEISFSSSDINLEPGFYHVLVDLRRKGKSICSPYFGSEEFYLRGKDESDAYAWACYDIGFYIFAKDPVFGGVFRGPGENFPPTYDPFNKNTYIEFLSQFATDTCKFAEVNQFAGVGLIHCAKMLRKMNKIKRAEYTDKLIKEITDQFMDVLMVDEKTGEVLVCRDEWEQKYPELFTSGLGDKWPHYDTGESGQVLLEMSQAYLYFREIPGYEKYTKKIIQQAEKIANFIMEYSFIDSPKHGKVFRRCFVPYSLEKKKIREDVSHALTFNGWVFSGISYFSYAYALEYGDLPEKYKEALYRSCQEILDIMRENDGMCNPKLATRTGALVEGNLYPGEAFLGAYLTFRELNDKEWAKKAGEGAYQAFSSFIERVVNPKYAKFYDFEGRGFLKNRYSNGHCYYLLSDYCKFIKEEPSFRDFMEKLYSYLIEMPKKRHINWAGGTTTDAALLLKVVGEKEGISSNE